MSIPNRPNRYCVTIPIDSLTNLSFDNLDKTDIDRLFLLMPKMRLDSKYADDNGKPRFEVTFIMDEPTAEEPAEPKEGAADGENTF